MQFSSHPSEAVVLVGGGGHATVVCEAAQLAGWRVGGYFDDDAYSSHLTSVPRLGAFCDAWQHDANMALILAIGNLSERIRFARHYRGRLASIVHPTAIVSPQASIGQGTFIAAAAILNPMCEVGQHSIINTRAVVEHHCNVSAHCHIGPGAVLGGGVSIGENTLVGISASVNPNIRVGRDCIVGAGAVVTRDIEAGSVVVGVPARPIPSRLRNTA